VALSHNQIKDLLRASLQKPANGYIYIRDVFDDYFIYSVEIYSNDSYSTKLYQQSYSIDAATNEVTLGDAVEVIERMEYVPIVVSASFDGAATFSDDQAWIEREGIIFRCGDYPDKGFSLNATEADAAISAFRPVNLELEHFDTAGRHSIFTGRLGQLTTLWRDGDHIKGKVKVPGEAGRKISAVWDKSTKQLRDTGAGLVLNPRVSEAALMSAFATFAADSESTAVRDQAQEFLTILQGAGFTAAPEGEDMSENLQNHAAAQGQNTPAPPPAPTAQDRRNAIAFEAAAESMAASAINALINGNVIKTELGKDLLLLAAPFAVMDLESRVAGVNNSVTFADGTPGTYLGLLENVIRRLAGEGHGLNKDGVQVHFSAPAQGSGGEDDDTELAELKAGAAAYAKSLNGTGQQR
jgi:hypothetical protein